MTIPKEELGLEKFVDILDRAFESINDAEKDENFILVVKDQANIRIYVLSATKYTIGRSQDNDIQISSKGISRHHATLCKRKNKFWIFDGSPDGKPSTNGLKINKRTCRSSKITSGDIINFYSESCAIFFELKSGTDYLSSKKELIKKVRGLGLRNYTNDNNIDNYQSFLDVLPDLIIKLNSNGVIVNLKESKDEIFSTYRKNLVGQAISDCFPPRISKILLESMQVAKETGKVQSNDCVIIRSGKKNPCEIQVSMERENIFFAIFKNIKDRKSIENKLLHDALHDNLTGLPNRKIFVSRVEESIQRRDQNINCGFAVLFVDLDRFKVINDSLGHLVGDQFIIYISDRLKKSLRPGDIISRFGGDEFAILINNIDNVDEATLITRRLQAELTKPLKLHGHELIPSASIGIVFGSDHYTNVNDMLRDADLAMYQAKAAGRSRFELFDQKMHQKAMNFLKLDSDLRQALKKHEFKLFYQPIVCLKSQKLIGLEALIRWFNPARGIVSPTDFIFLAEETGLIVPLGEWALEEGCRQLSLWHQMDDVNPDLTLNINLSSKQFSSANLTQYIASLLNHYSLNPRSLKLEITESIIMENSQFSVDIFLRLRELGVQICIDDFGTGYSSLSYLHRFPIDALKIDRSFVSAMDDAAQNTGFAIAQSVVGLAHNLGVKVVAEGIENARHLVWLRSFQCDYGQGYFFAKPLEVEQATALIKGELEWSYRQNNPGQAVKSPCRSHR